MFRTKYRGYFNKYHENMPIFEVITKDISYFNLLIKNYFRNGKKSKTILVSPEYPSRSSTIYKIGKVLGYNITNKPTKNIELGVYWENTTFRKDFQFLETLAKTKKIINLHSRDISKQHIDKIHNEVFGYSSIVDPLIYEGEIVKKNDLNAKHDGEILLGPIDKIEDGFIYQILIDNKHSENLVMDIRVPVVNKVLDFAYIKYRDISERFKNTTTNTVLEPIDNVLSADEIKLLNEYCAKLNLEYGELDVLRNKNDNKIYVVDVNNTPNGPPSNISSKDGKTALNKIANAVLAYANDER
ncbi:hypothetical protein [Brumimicrobium mesophilum]|uniref:hypothetical protein n=1 Tax=Brumimicrobium mesophilum TaxID=392717 RepID=UPI001F3F313E|nr:hypothetical protein [Brumimicrobium mesophilum]